MDKIIQELIEKEKKREQQVVNLVASENYAPLEILNITGSCLTNKYAEGYPSKRYYQGCEIVDEVEQLAIDRAKILFNAEHANVQPHSGSQANAAVLMALLKPNDTVLALRLEQGGHLTHGLHLNFSGTYYNFVFYDLDSKNHNIEYDKLDEYCAKHKPKLIICGYSAYSRQIDFKIFSEIAKKHNAYLLADIAHIAGIVAAQLHPSPVPYADVVTFTTHKSLQGPRGGIILCKKELAKKIDSAVFPGQQGGPQMHTIAAKATCFLNAMSEKFLNYQKQVLANAKAFANAFKENGYKVIANQTDNHLFMLDMVQSKNLTGKEAAKRLEQINIICNKNLIPYDELSPFVTSGIRFGVYATTAIGFVEQDYLDLFAIINEAFSDSFNEDKARILKQKVLEIILKHKKNFKKYF